MTKKEVEKLKKWNFGKKPIKGYITLFPESAKYLKSISDYQKGLVEDGKVFYIHPDENGFKINETGISCKTREYGVTSSREIIPFKAIQKVRFYEYNY